jgi:quercetin dioxygenase-like cupin family protein
MTQTENTQLISAGPGEGESLWVMGSLWTLKAADMRTRGAYALTETILVAGSEPPPHIHHSEDEAIYVLEGELSFQVGDSKFERGPGSFVFMPKDVAHGFTVLGGEETRVLFIFSPPGIEGFFRGVGLPGDTPTPPPPPEGPPPPEVMKLIEQHGLEFVG